MKHEVALSPEAAELYNQKWRENELLFREGGSFYEMKDWGGKFMGNIIRIAGAIHVAQYSTSYQNKNISKATMESALKIGQYLVPHAQAAYGLVSENHDVVMAKRVLAWIRENKFVSFTQHDCHKRFKATLITAQQVTKVLDLLKERGYIRDLTTQPSVGRPSKMFEVNPKIY